MTRDLFGTDGIRGLANIELTPELALSVARAAGYVLGRHQISHTRGSGAEKSIALLGRDTRRSGSMLSSALAAGFCSMGLDVLDVGVIPTPGVAYLTMQQRAIAGAVVSASHNPAADNGIKFFGPDGFKLDDEVESEIEMRVGTPDDLLVPGGTEIGVVRHAPLLAALYEAHLVSSVGEGHLAGLKVVLDCANGAAFDVAPRVYEAAGASVEAIFVDPDGDNINLGCGSTDMNRLCEMVADSDADLGLAFDGDADRVLAVDAGGTVVDGDQILAIAAVERRVNRVVTTVMTNLGFRRCMERHGIEIIECPVGDRHVIDAMRREGIAIGGEQSGHIIFGNDASTGDGVLTGLKLMAMMAESGKALSELAAVMDRYPQVLLNVNVRDRTLLKAADQVWQEVRAVEERLGADGRVLIRPSGTESVVRVMVEARDASLARSEAGRLATLVEMTMG